MISTFFLAVIFHDGLIVTRYYTFKYMCIKVHSLCSLIIKAHVTWNVCTVYGPGEMVQINSKNKKPPRMDLFRGKPKTVCA